MRNSAGENQADHLPTNAYMTRSCPDLRAEKVATAQKLETSTAMQKQAVNSDALGVFFVGLPVGSMAGGERGSEVAVYKGQSAAIDRALKAKGC